MTDTERALLILLATVALRLQQLDESDDAYHGLHALIATIRYEAQYGEIPS